MFFRWLLLLAPISWVLAWGVHAPPIWVFTTSVLSLIPLADMIRQATEQLSNRAGSAVGGLLNVSFGNAPELIVGLFVLSTGHIEVVKAQLTGAIIGNSLLGLGLAILIGGWGTVKQSFRKERAHLLGSLMTLAFVALLLPAIFAYSQRGLLPTGDISASVSKLSTGVAIVLIAVYIANLVYTLVTHRDIFAAASQDHKVEWSTFKSVAVMVIATAATAVEAELLSGTLEQAAKSVGLSEVFVGAVIIAIAGNVTEKFSAIYFAKADRMGLVVSITMGSTIQIALLVAPLIVLLSPITGHPMDLNFSSPLQLIAIAGSAIITNTISRDGETTWFEGLMLVAVYVMFALGFLFAGDPTAIIRH